MSNNKKIADLEWPPSLNGVDNEEESNRAISVLGPVNGIYCICNRSADRWAGNLILWNPATKDHKQIIPRVAFPFPFEFFQGNWYHHWYFEWLSPRGLHIGFGNNNKTNDFKEVVIFHWELREGYDDESWHIRVYNLSTNTWRTIYYLRPYISSLHGDMYDFFRISSYPDFVHCYLNNVFHWSNGPEYNIITFHMDTETFELIKGPPLLSLSLHKCLGLYRDSSHGFYHLRR